MSTYSLLFEESFSTCGYFQEERYRRKIKEAIRDNLPHILTEEGFILEKGKVVFRFPLRSFKGFALVYEASLEERVGQGPGDTPLGKILFREPLPGGSPWGKGAGDQEGDDYYEGEITLDQVEEIVWEELVKTCFQKRDRENQGQGQREEFKGVGPKGLWANLDKRLSLLTHLKEDALWGKRGGGKTEEGKPAL